MAKTGTSGCYFSLSVEQVGQHLPKSYWQLYGGKESSELRRKGGLRSAVHTREHLENLTEVTGSTLKSFCTILFHLLFKKYIL